MNILLIKRLLNNLKYKRLYSFQQEFSNFITKLNQLTDFVLVLKQKKKNIFKDIIIK